MKKVKSLEIREVEYSYDTRPKINGMSDVVKAVKPMIADPNKEFFITLYLRAYLSRLISHGTQIIASQNLKWGVKWDL